MNEVTSGRAVPDAPSGINRRGQKVVCVAEMEVSDAVGNVYRGPLPVVLQTYTVDAFVDSRMVDEDDAPASASTLPGITLLELPPLRGKGGKIFGWPIVAFRPAVEDSKFSSISQMIEAARTARPPARTREPA